MDNNSLIRMAEQYGYEMELHGKSLYWSSPRVCPDTTEKLKNDPSFLKLSREEQQKILEYGNLRKRWGMGCYQEIGYNANWYSKGVPPANPFSLQGNGQIGDDGEER